MSTCEYQFYNLITRDCVPDIYNQFKHCGFTHNVKVWNMYSYDVRRSKVIDSRNTVIHCTQAAMAKYQSLFPAAKVESIDMDKLHVPKTEKRETWNVHVKGFPTTWSPADVKSYLGAFLDAPVGEHYQVKTPVDRATGEIYGYTTISFDNKEVEPRTIAILRWVIHNRSGESGNYSWVLSARWHVSHQQTEKKVIKPRSTTGIRVISIEKAVETQQ